MAIHTQIDIRKLLDERRPHQWLSRDGGTPHLRSGHPLSGRDAVRLTTRPVPGPDCPECGRDRWIPYTDIRDQHTAKERLTDLLLCRSCGHQRPDDRTEIQP